MAQLASDDLPALPDEHENLRPNCAAPPDIPPPSKRHKVVDDVHVEPYGLDADMMTQLPTMDLPPPSVEPRSSSPVFAIPAPPRRAAVPSVHTGALPEAINNFDCARGHRDYRPLRPLTAFPSAATSAREDDLATTTFVVHRRTSVSPPPVASACAGTGVRGRNVVAGEDEVVFLAEMRGDDDIDAIGGAPSLAPATRRKRLSTTLPACATEAGMVSAGGGMPGSGRRDEPVGSTPRSSLGGSSRLVVDLVASSPSLARFSAAPPPPQGGRSGGLSAVVGARGAPSEPAPKLYYETVRNKDARAQLEGYPCTDCEKVQHVRPSTRIFLFIF